MCLDDLVSCGEEACLTVASVRYVNFSGFSYCFGLGGVSDMGDKHG